MNYPVWNVPVIGGVWVIGIIAIVHMMVALFAVGGGLYLPMAEAKAMREGRESWMPVIKKHSRFFMILTNTLGAVTGVGIWFAIGLVQPEATSTLIHNFVFGWAMEWVCFIVELTAAAVYYYSWGRIPKELHLKVGWLYAIASFLTLVIINGILAFMLTPGKAWLDVAGTGQEASRFWMAFFNPTYFPSLVVRILVCVAFAGIYALLSISRMEDETFEKKGRIAMTRWSASWLLPIFTLMPIAFLWYFAMMPNFSKDLLQLGFSTIGSGAFTQVTRIALVSLFTTATIAGVVYFFAYKHPKEFSPGHAWSIVFLALAATGSTEYAREAIRKPYVIGEHMYSNSLRKNEIQKFNTDGYLTSSMWVAKDSMDELAKGKIMFAGQCLSCHTETGYRSMKRLMGPRDAESVMSLLNSLHEAKDGNPYKKYMPPLVGKKEEIEALGLYLVHLTKATKAADEATGEPVANAAKKADEAPKENTTALNMNPGPAMIGVN